MLSTSISVTGSSPPATHKRSSRTSSRGITFRNVNPQSGNGVEKIEHVEHKFNWVLPADPDPKSDNYYNGIVSKELKDSSNIVETLLDRLGIKSDKPLTRKEKLLAFIGFKAGLMWERLAEIQTKLASPDPIEMVIMRTLKNGKNADFTAEVLCL